MRRLEIIVRQTDEAGKPLPEIASLELTFQVLAPAELRPGEGLDQLEQEVVAIGMEVLRQVLTWRVESVDAELAQARRHRTEACCVTFDGKKALTMATVMGRIRPRRQVCHCKSCGEDFMPLNRLLPEHHHLVITRGLEELACLFALMAPYEWVHRWLVHLSRDERVLSPREVQEIILRHGRRIRTEEEAQAEAILAQEEPPSGEAILVPGAPPRREPAWPEAVAQAVEEALNGQAWEDPPQGISRADWERVVTHVQQHVQTSKNVQALARLGPRLGPQELLVAVDGIVVRGCEKGRRLELRVARLQTAEGYRYVTGIGEAFLTKLEAAIKTLMPTQASLTVLADGARWIRDFFETVLAPYENRELILDWYHLTKKCKELLSMIAHGRQHRREILRHLMPALWEGNVEKAITILQALQPQARNKAALDDLMVYLQKHRPYIPNYRQRRAHCQFNSSNAAERACNVLVARRQKHKSMHWILQGADALCALQTLWHNRAWDLYWKSRQVLPLFAPVRPPAFAC